MAQIIQTSFIDDIDGSDAEGTVRFGLDGAHYEIDLSAENANGLRKALAQYVEAARRTGSSVRPGRARSGSHANALGGGASTKEIRDWAKAQGIKVEDRGRIPANIIMQFNAAKMTVRNSTAPVRNSTAPAGLRPPVVEEAEPAVPAVPEATFTEPAVTETPRNAADSNGSEQANVKSGPATKSKARQQSKTPAAAPKGGGKAKAKDATPAVAKTAKYDPELRAKAVRQVQEGATVAAVARELAVAEGSIRNWLRAAEQISAKTA